MPIFLDFANPLILRRSGRTTMFSLLAGMSGQKRRKRTMRNSKKKCRDW